MNHILAFLLLFTLVGCSSRKTASETTPKTPAVTATEPVLTPSTEKFGRVAMVNASARFVVLNFPIGEVAARGQRLNVYRNGLKVGEVQVTGPQRENNTVADIVTGNPRVDDDVREN